jgi:small subunit ribosomal protein S20
MVKSRVKTSIRKLMELVESKDKENAQKQYRDIASLVDRAASKGTMPRNTAARKKRRLHRSLSKLA